MSGIHRRSVLKGLAGLGGALALRPVRGVAATALGGLPSSGASRRSKLARRSRTFLIHADLHNHTLVSGDAEGSPDVAYRQMRARGLDAVCLSEHAISGKGHGEVTCGDHEAPCRMITGINETDWRGVREVADRFDAPGRFVVVPGFEYSTPTVGHANVWYSEGFTDALQTNAFVTPTAIAEADQIGLPSEVVDNFESAPELATIDGFWRWMSSPPDRAVLGGGNDGIASFNHPNEYGTFGDFRLNAAAAPYMVGVEALNTDRDFFWYGTDEGMPNPFVAILDAGWHVGFHGVSDEHGPPYGRPGRGRAGIWVPALTREGVRRGLRSRRTFATFEPGMRLDASANGAPMGSAVRGGFERLHVQLDLDRGPAWTGRRLIVEAVTSNGDGSPRLAGVFPVRVPAPSAPPIALTVRGARDWMFLRITDPRRKPHRLAPEPYRSHGGVVAYASPFYAAGHGTH